MNQNKQRLYLASREEEQGAAEQYRTAGARWVRHAAGAATPAVQEPAEKGIEICSPVAAAVVKESGRRTRRRGGGRMGIGDRPNEGERLARTR